MRLLSCFVKVVESMEEKRFEPGDLVIKEGGAGDYFYVTGSGELEVSTFQVQYNILIRQAQIDVDHWS